MVIEDDFIYEWHNAPDWAEFATTDFDGYRRWYQFEPAIWDLADCWCAHHGLAEEQNSSLMPPVDNWRTSLRKRPPDPERDVRVLLQLEAGKGAW